MSKLWTHAYCQNSTTGSVVFSRDSRLRFRRLSKHESNVKTYKYIKMLILHIKLHEALYFFKYKIGFTAFHALICI